MKRKERKLILALDTGDRQRVNDLVKLLYPRVDYFKVGLELFTSFGPEIVSQLKHQGCKVFVDLKLHDIPNTVGRAAVSLAKMGVDMLNIHLSGGIGMSRAAVEEVRHYAAEQGVAAPLIIGVTVLTSTGMTDYSSMGYTDTLERRVVRLAQMGKEAGLDGVVASPREAQSIRAACGPDFVLVTPGIRPLWAAKNDQQRITTPKEALDLGADYLVVGRPITAAQDPLSAAEKILAEMEGE
ncbi:orotidine-5'-phosphate decarboxylase [Metallumcola ferriviriculae]|uniref:Orotidine 5'-phosphate decarboxylase n=1 Tax=Metallumcola ferriviriculae TaxID=3039180 RepID=A0AAU0UN78_9FIRM|nr:orotidine-5'-phosphate decarboxylase [Desulfitibacteraceae bacterium MK1]